MSNNISNNILNYFKSNRFAYGITKTIDKLLARFGVQDIYNLKRLLTGKREEGVQILK